ncbi:MAG: hypothetical protein Q9157_002455 [Trypethelium eluteriae]
MVAQRLTGQRERNVMANCNTVKSWLREKLHSRVLIVFDDLDEINFEAYRPLMPFEGSGDIIITTKSEEAAMTLASSTSKILKIKEWSDWDVLDYLRIQLGDDSVDLEESTARDLVKSTCKLPIAVEQLARHTKFLNQTLTQTLKDVNVFTSPTVTNGVLQSFEATFSRLERRAPLAIKLAYFLAFLEPNALGNAILDSNSLALCPSLSQLTHDTVTFKKAYNRLLDVGLLRWNKANGTFSFHDLAHLFLRYRLTPEDRLAMIREAIHFIWIKFPPWDDVHIPENWEKASMFLPHAICVIEHADRFDIATQEVLEILARAARNLVEKGLEDLARQFGNRAHSRLNSTPGLSVVQRIRIMKTAGYVLNYNGDYQAASPIYRDVLRLAETELGLQNEETLTCYHNMADIYFKQGDNDIAISMWTNVIDIGRSIQLDSSEHGVHPFASMTNLAEAYRKKDDTLLLPKAEAYLREAMAGFQRRQSEMSSWTLYSKGQLGMNLHEQAIAGIGDAEEAAQYLREAFRGLEEVLGPEDQFTKEVQEDLDRLKKRFNTHDLSASQISLD